MKAFISTVLALTALSLPLAAQENDEEQTAVTLNAYVKLKQGKKPARIIVHSVPGKNVFSYIPFNTPAAQPEQLNVKDCDMFLLINPKELVNAMPDYNGNRLDSARNKLAQVKTKYAGFVGIPGSPAAKAAELELDCAIRLLDWAGVKNLADHFRGKGDLGEWISGKVDVAKVLGLLSTSKFADAVIEQATALTENKSKPLHLEQYGWVNYALGRAYEAKIPSKELSDGVLSEASVETANRAVDAYATAMATTYGGKTELAADASARAAILLSAMPGVKDALQTLGSKRDSYSLKKLPMQAKEAAAMAYIHLNLMNPKEQNPALTELASLRVQPVVKKSQSQESQESAAASAATSQK